MTILSKENLLKSNEHSPVYALSATEVAKTIYSNSKIELQLEAEKLAFANNINNLLVKFIRLDCINGINVIVTERLYPMQSRAFDNQQKQNFLSDFAIKLSELHHSGFTHGDLGYPILFNSEFDRTNVDRTYIQSDNIIITQQGIQLVDAGRSSLKEDVGVKRFNETKHNDFHGFFEIETALRQNQHNAFAQVVESDYIISNECLINRSINTDENDVAFYH